MLISLRGYRLVMMTGSNVVLIAWASSWMRLMPTG